VLVANVLTGNPGHARLLALIEREQPDVVALVEVDDDWLAALSPLTATYPHHLAETRDDNFGVALFSRRPFASATIIHPGAFELPAIDVRLAGELPLRVVLAHPPPPITGDYVAVRDETFAALATLLAGDPNAVLVGDLNCTPWTAPFRRLLRDGHLRDTRVGVGAQASWPAGLGRLGIPIDHVLVGSAVTVGERRLGEAIGSDHRPLLAQLGLRPGG
jgi:endonuclease/exonuclease/phosphatase (EEP) superfamily protein YafD